MFPVQDQDLNTKVDGSSPKPKGVEPEIRNATNLGGPVSNTATSIPALVQAQGQGDVAQVEKQEWEIIKILDRRETVSGTECMIRWKTHGWLKVN